MFLSGKAKNDELMDILGNYCGVGLWDARLVNEDALHPESQWMWTNEFRRLLGFKNESDFPNVCRSWSDKLHPDDATRTFAAFNEALKKKSAKSLYDVTYRLKMADGRYRWFRATGGVVHDSNGKAIRACGSLVDIDDVTVAANAAKERAGVLGNLTNEFDREMSALTETVSGAATRFEATAQQLAELGRAHVQPDGRRFNRCRASRRECHRRRGCRRTTRIVRRRNPPPGRAVDGNVAGRGEGSKYHRCDCI